jgi:MSHA biogenesis protein MshI
VLKLLRRNNASDRRSAVTTSSDAWASATVRRPHGARPILEACRSQDASGSDMDSALGVWINSQRQSLGRVSAVLDSNEYQLLLVEAPDVLPAELKAAIRWRLKDLIDFPVEESVVDVFDTPDQARRTGSKMMYAVAARRAAVERRVSQLSPVGAHFDVIDVPELALRNLVAQLPEAKDGLILLWLERTAAQLILVKNSILYLSRRVEFQQGFDFGRNAEGNDVEAIALELQRSMDYFESHYEQAPIAQLIVAPAADATGLINALAKETPMRIQALDLSRVLDIAPGVVATGSLALMAIGAALRHDPKSL